MPENNSFESFIPDVLHDDNAHYLLVPIQERYLKSLTLTESTEKIYGNLVMGLIGLLPLLIVCLNWFMSNRFTADNTFPIVLGVFVCFFTLIGLTHTIPAIKKLSGYQAYRTLIVDSAGIRLDKTNISWEDIEYVNLKVFIKEGKYYYPYILIRLLSQEIIAYDLDSLYHEKDFLINTKEDLVNALSNTKPEFKMLRVCLGYYLT